MVFVLAFLCLILRKVPEKTSYAMSQNESVKSYENGIVKSSENGITKSIESQSIKSTENGFITNGIIKPNGDVMSSETEKLLKQ